MTTATDFRHVVLETGAQASLEKGKRELLLLSCVALRIALLQACSLLWFSCTEQNALGLCGQRPALLWGCAAAVGLWCCCAAAPHRQRCNCSRSSSGGCTGKMRWVN